MAQYFTERLQKVFHMIFRSYNQKAAQEGLRQLELIATISKMQCQLIIVPCETICLYFLKAKLIPKRMRLQSLMIQKRAS